MNARTATAWISLTLALLVAAPVAAAPCLDFDAWRAAVIAGDADTARGAIITAQTACGCADDAALCLGLPGFSEVTSPKELRDTTDRLLQWHASLVGVCDRQDADPERETELENACYSSRARVFSEGLAGEKYGRLWAPIPLEIAGQLVPKSENGQPLPGGVEARPKKEYSYEIQKIGRQICTATIRLEQTKQRHERVLRRTSMVDGDKRAREIELLEEIKDLSELISNLKRDFRQKTGETFTAYDFCGPHAEP
jgi:hypothetical protein